MRVILLNAPPRAGKDSAALMIYDMVRGSRMMKFAHPLFNSIPKMFGLSNMEWKQMYHLYKELPSEKLMGMTPREAMIWLSEEVMKPKFGKGFFGKTAYNEISSHMREWDLSDNPVFVFSDSGFVEEVEEMIQSGIPRESIYLVNISREGCTFDNDSRVHINPEDIDIPDFRHYHIVNSGSLDDLRQDVKNIVRDIGLRTI